MANSEIIYLFDYIGTAHEWNIKPHTYVHLAVLRKNWFYEMVLYIVHTNILIQVNCVHSIETSAVMPIMVKYAVVECVAQHLKSQV